MGTDLFVSMMSVVAVSAALEGPPKPASPAAQLLPVEQNMVLHTNVERARHGLHPLAVSPRLMQSARRHCHWMASAHSMTHSSGVAENIAMGQYDSVAAVQAWMNSSGHRANMLGGYRYVGAAGYRTASGAVYWCIQFSN